MVEWTEVDGDELHQAQRRAGFSDERLARELHIATKTWARWRKSGRVPTHMLIPVASLLNIELAAPTPIPVDVSPRGVTPHELRESLAAVVSLLKEIAQSLARVDEMLSTGHGPPAKPTPRPEQTADDRALP